MAIYQINALQKLEFIKSIDISFVYENVDFPPQIQSVSIYKNKLIIASLWGFLLLYDIEDPINPKQEFNYKIADQITNPLSLDSKSLIIYKDYLYISCDAEGLKKIDLNNTGVNLSIRTLYGNRVLDFEIVNENSIIAINSNGDVIKILIENSNYTEIKNLGNIPNNILICIVEHHAYLLDSSGFLRIFDLNDFSNPIQTVNTNIVNCQIMEHYESFLYFSTNSSSIHIMDIHNPLKTEMMSSIIFERTSSTEIYLNNLVAYFNNSVAYIPYDNKIYTISLNHSKFSNLKSLGFKSKCYRNESTIIVSDAYAYLNESKTFQIIDISNQNKLIPLGLIETSCHVSKMKLNDNTIFFIDKNTLGAINISNKNEPEIISKLDNLNDPTDISFCKQKGYVTADGGIYTIDIEQPDKLTRENIILNHDDREYSCIEILEPIAYVAYTSKINAKTELLSVDIENTPPRIISSCSLGNIVMPKKLIVQDNMVYIMGMDSIKIVEIDIFHQLMPISTIQKMSLNISDIDISESYIFSTQDIGLVIHDITTPESPIYVDTLKVPNSAANLSQSTCAVKNNFLYYGCKSLDQEYDFQLTRFPKPKIASSLYINKKKLKVHLPQQEVVGDYTLGLYNQERQCDLPGAISYRAKFPKAKAIIINGAKLEPDTIYSSSIWEETHMCANYAFDALVSQGYSHKDIYYLSQSYFEDVDDLATKENIIDALEKCENSVEDLLIYIVNQRFEKDSFRINENEHFSANEFAQAINNLQQKIPVNIIVIYDACNSGSFISTLKKPDQISSKRIVITSASQNQKAIYELNGSLSFSYFFWSSIFYGGHVKNAFILSRDMIEEHHQTPLLDFDGNGKSTEEDLMRMNQNEEIVIGLGNNLKTDMPFISEVAPPRTLKGETTADIWVGKIIDCDEISKVWAIIYPPCFHNGSSDNLLINLPSIELHKTDDTQNTSMEYMASYDDFFHMGTYRVIIYAQDHNNIFSLPATTYYTQTIGIESMQKIPLNKGWNNISYTIKKCFYVNHKPDIEFTDDVTFEKVDSIDDLFKSIDNQYSYIRTYDRTGALTYNDTSFSNLYYLSPEHEYWIKIKDDANFDEKGFVYLVLKGECFSR